jgi:hypothetical protein
MALRPQSIREWAVIVIGSALVVAVIVWLYVIDPWMNLLDKNAEEIDSKKKLLVDFEEGLKKSVELEREYIGLIQQYSNHLQNIRDVRMPDNLKDVLRREFYNIDQQYQSSTRRTVIRDPETNEMYTLLPYGLSGVECDWPSLNMLLYLIEDAGQLVGFENMTIDGYSPDRKNPAKIKTKISQMSVKSYMFDKGSTNWTIPDYTKVADTLKRNIFKLPDSIGPSSKPQPPITDTMIKGELPPWSRHITLTALVNIGRPHAVFNNKSKRRSYRVDIGGTISNASPESILSSIDFRREEAIVQAGGREYTIPLRVYKEALTDDKKQLSFATTTPEATSAEPEPEPAGEEVAVAMEKTEVPKTYEKELGSYAECSVKLGVFLIKVDTYVQRRNRLDTDYGMMVYRTQKLSPAVKGGIKPRDVIVEIDGKKIDSTSTFTYAMNEAYKSNKSAISMTVKRQKGLQQITVNME